MESDDPRLLLGVFAPDRVRSVVVITTNGELAVAVRDAVPAGIAVVRDARPDDASGGRCSVSPVAVDGCRLDESVTPGLASLLRTRPVLTLWLGVAPAGLPGHVRAFRSPHGVARRPISRRVHRDGRRLCVSPPAAESRWTTATCFAGRHSMRSSARIPAVSPCRRARFGVSTPRFCAQAWAGRRSVTRRAHRTRPVRTHLGCAMRANPEVLILEDDAETLEGLQSHFTRKRFHPLAARSASRALSLLENNRYSSRPVLAIVDWDLGKAPDQAASSGDVLSRLARELRECPVIVYSQNIDAFNVRSQIQRSHPRALLHDKRDGDTSLLERVDRMLDRTVGDLRVHDGTVVVHVPSLDQHHHREAIRLVVHHPDIVTFHSDTSTKAVRRFGEWLREHDSAVRLVSHGNRKYRLSVTVTTGSMDSRRDGVNLTIADIAELPLAAALLDSNGDVIARTPEWDGPGPGAVAYPVRTMRLVVRTRPASQLCDAVLSRLLDSHRRFRRGLDVVHAQRVRMLACSLRLVAGREAGRWGSTDEVLDLARAGITARTGLTVDIVTGAVRPVLAPEVAALVLVQLAVNAERHDAAERVRRRGRQDDIPCGVATRG